MHETLRSETRTGYRVLTLNRPDKMNALNRPLLQALIAALADAASDASCRALLLTATGRGFCAGADLDSVTDGADLGEAIDQTWNPLARALHNLPMPTVCAVNGIAAGAGANLALGCDIVLAARSARFIQAFSKIGLIPDAGGTFHLPRLVGEGRARALAMLAEPVDADRAEAWGMIWRAVDDAELMGEAEKFAAYLAVQPTQALVLTRRALAASAGNDFNAQLEVERELQRECGRTPDFHEGVRAFLEKRAPSFTGRKA
jgi:2-(1,2-epoxy-1,2-dihydrophenyl)acetyl-CoA isomerase